MVRLSIPAQLAYRDLALSAVLTAIEAADGPHAEHLPDGVRDEIVSALNEAFNNVVLHAYQGLQGGRIELTVTTRCGEVEIHLHDRGRSFDPASVSGYSGAADEMDVMALPENGMGLFIIRSFMDDVSYTAGSGSRPNTLVMRKRWPISASAGDDRPLRPASAAGPGGPGSASSKESAQSGWRMRSVAVPSDDLNRRTAGSLKRK